jgi:hypothetical protein
MPLHIIRGEIAMTAPANVLLLGLSLFVLWGRPLCPRHCDNGCNGADEKPLQA